MRFSYIGAYLYILVTLRTRSILHRDGICGGYRGGR